MDVDALFRQLHPSLFRYLHRLTGEEDTAADLAQEAFVRLLGHQLPEDEVRPWLFTVATNLVRDGARQSTRHRRLLAVAPVAPAPPAAPADEAVEREEAAAGVRAALARLAPRDRQMLLMREEGFRYEEIARVIGVAPSSMGTLLARALRRFKEAYGRQGTRYDSRE